MRTYWLDLFTGKTWNEFLKNGATISGFREHREKVAEKIAPGDYFLCYLTGISRFIGILEVKSKSFFDITEIWVDEVFPVRLKVELLYNLNPETAIPVLNLKEKLSIFNNLKFPSTWGTYFRGSPVRFRQDDGETITNMIIEAFNNPVERPFDEKKLWKRPRKIKSKNFFLPIKTK